MKKKKRILRLSIKLFLLLFVFSGVLIFLTGRSSYRMFMTAAVNQNLGFESGIASFIADYMVYDHPQLLSADTEEVDPADYKKLQENIEAIRESVSMSMIAVIGFEEVEDGYSTYLVAGAGGDLKKLEYRDWIELEKVDVEYVQIAITTKEPVSYTDEEYDKDNGLKLLSVIPPIT